MNMYIWITCTTHLDIRNIEYMFDLCIVLYCLSYVTETKIQSLLPIPPAGVLLLRWLSSLIWSTKMWLIKFHCIDYCFQLPNVVCWANEDTPSISIVLLVYHQWNHALPPAVSLYACCFSLHVYNCIYIIYIYISTYNYIHINQSYSAPSCQSNQAHTHTNHLCKDPSFQQSGTVIGQNAVKGI